MSRPSLFWIFRAFLPSEKSLPWLLLNALDSQVRASMATIPEGTSTATAQAHNDSNTGNGSSSIKDKLHHIGEKVRCFHFSLQKCVYVVIDVIGILITNIKLALVPPRQEEVGTTTRRDGYNSFDISNTDYVLPQLTNRLEEAEAKGDKDEIAKVKRRISASNQDASTAVE